MIKFSTLRNVVSVSVNENMTSFGVDQFRITLSSTARRGSPVACFSGTTIGAVFRGLALNFPHDVRRAMADLAHL